MNKKINFIVMGIIVCLSFFIAQTNVNANCTYSDIEKFAKTAAKAKIKTEIIWTDIYKVTITNMTKDFYVVNDETGTTFYYDIESDNPSITSATFIAGKNYTLNFKPASYECPEQILRTKTLELPRYNAYSERKECDDNEKYVYCRQYINLKINEEQFLDGIKNYNASKAKEEDKKEDNEPLSWYQSIFNYVINNFLMLTFVGLGAIVLIMVLILFLKKRRIIKKPIKRGHNK